MRRILTVLLCLLLLSAAGSAEDILGTWSGDMGGGGIRILKLDGDGTGSLSEDGYEQAIEWDEAYTIRADGKRIASFELQDGFLIFRDAEDEVWPMLRSEAELPSAIDAESETAFYGAWHADFAVVSGFRIPLDDIEISYTIAEGQAVCSGTGYDQPVSLPVRMMDGRLVIQSSQEDMEVVLMLREDGSMTRDMTYMTIHFVR